MTRDPVTQSVGILGEVDLFEIDTGAVAARLAELTGFIQHVSDPARHAGGEVLAGICQADDQAPSHIFAAVIAQAFDDSRCPGIAYRESLTGAAVKECLARGCSVEHHV